MSRLYENRIPNIFKEKLNMWRLGENRAKIISIKVIFEFWNYFLHFSNLKKILILYDFENCCLAESQSQIKLTKEYNTTFS